VSGTNRIYVFETSGRRCAMVRTNLSPTEAISAYQAAIGMMAENGWRPIKHYPASGFKFAVTIRDATDEEQGIYDAASVKSVWNEIAHAENAKKFGVLYRNEETGEFEEARASANANPLLFFRPD
jgi:hypothetical protein